jgi:hypothetical protein
MLEELYTEMIKENRVYVKWSHEYKLYDIISKYVCDAIYQYRAVWLGSQSFDIFIPSQNIAIEYQGQQHYEAVELFGGQESLERNKERDERKRRLSSEHGINVVDWKYDIRITTDSVLHFFKVNNIEVTSSGYNVIKKNINLSNMAPIQQKVKEDQVKTVTPKFLIKQFSTDGVFITNFISYEEASQSASVSKQQISNAVRGIALTAGGYQWRKVSPDKADNNEMTEIEISSSERTNTGFSPKAVRQISTEGEVISEYDSISLAAKTVGVNNKSIRCVLSGKQKTAGGYFWEEISNN